MKTTLALALVASLGLAVPAFAQPVPSGGPSAKGNAPLKPAHTVNDGAAKGGANSFTEGQARQHILNAGYQAVTGLAKGDDGVWRGVARKDGANRDVAMDFKGNVSEAAAPAALPTGSVIPSAAGGAAMSGMSSGDAGMRGSASPQSEPAKVATASPRKHHRRHHRRHGRACHSTGVNGAACSGVDRNDNGVSDREDRTRR